MTSLPGRSDVSTDGADGADGVEVTPEDLLRQVLDRARTQARTSHRRSAKRPRPSPGTTRSGAWPDERDPQLLGDELNRLAEGQGWQATLPTATLMGAWDRIVGADVAAHCRPERLLDGELVLVAESTAWATQLRLLTRQILQRIRAEVGDGLVTGLLIHGPTVPSWRRGQRRVTGRGPRDTYG